MEITREVVKTQEQIGTVHDIAKVVWHETYDSLLPEGQAAYMVAQLQSPQALEKQLTTGYEYFLMRCDGIAAGYFAIQKDHQESGSLFLSKVYLRREFRGQGVMKAVMAFLFDYAKENGQRCIWLTVNKENTHAQQVYGRYGFSVVEAVVNDIGGGYVMDDYVMRCELPQAAGQ